MCQNEVQILYGRGPACQSIHPRQTTCAPRRSMHPASRMPSKVRLDPQNPEPIPAEQLRVDLLILTYVSTQASGSAFEGEHRLSLLLAARSEWLIDYHQYQMVVVTIFYDILLTLADESILPDFGGGEPITTQILETSGRQGS